MYVGFMANFDKPTKLAKVIAMMCKNYHIDLIYLRPKDVNIEKNTVSGRVFRNNRWVKNEVKIPPFIDIAPYCFMKKNKEITDYLKEQTFLSDNRDNVITKEKLQERLKEDEKFSHLVIPTERVGQFEDILTFLEQYKTVVIKPIHGLKGRGVFM